MQMIRSLEPITPGTQGFGCEFPVDSEIMSVGLEGTDGYVYALGDPGDETQTYTFTAPATGEDVPATGAQFIGSVTLGSPRIVYHVFEILQ